MKTIENKLGKVPYNYELSDNIAKMKIVKFSEEYKGKTMDILENQESENVAIMDNALNILKEAKTEESLSKRFMIDGIENAIGHVNNIFKKGVGTVKLGGLKQVA